VKGAGGGAACASRNSACNLRVLMSYRTSEMPRSWQLRIMIISLIMIMPHLASGLLCRICMQ
jgi:hypothetical protein